MLRIQKWIKKICYVSEIICTNNECHYRHIVMTEMPFVPIDVSVDGDVDYNEEYGPRAEYYVAISAVSLQFFHSIIFIK